MRLPEATIGECRNSKKCKNYRVVLGDGLCEICWDKGIDNSQSNRKNYLNVRSDTKKKSEMHHSREKSRKSALVRVLSKVFSSNRYQI